jgi:hypothetical protein
MEPASRTTRARIAALTRHRPEAAETVELSRQFKAERLGDYIQRVVDAAPALTQEQRDKLALLLRGEVR